MVRSSSRLRRLIAAAGTVAVATAPLAAQGPRQSMDRPPAPVGVEPDLVNTPTLYVVGYAHLDTEWRWEYPQVISEYLLHTMEDNFTLFDKYPAYVFNFTGANRYRLMKEYWPADYARMASYIKAGRWFPAGSSMEEGDVNAPVGRSDPPPGAVRQRVFPEGIRRRQRGVHAPRLLRLSVVAAEHSGARRDQGVLHPEAHLGLLGARRLDHPVRHGRQGRAVQLRTLGRP